MSKRVPKIRVVSIAVTEQEHEKLFSEAQTCDLSVSAYLRMLLEPMLIEREDKNEQELGQILGRSSIID